MSIMISSLDSKVMDANSEALGTSVLTLMDNAGKAVADLLRERPTSTVMLRWVRPARKPFWGFVRLNGQTTHTTYTDGTTGQRFWEYLKDIVSRVFSGVSRRDCSGWFVADGDCLYF